MILDSTVIRAHQHAAGAEKKQRSDRGLRTGEIPAFEFGQ
jgi:hypothetical protein